MAHCINCGSTIEADWKLCPKCGKPIEAAPQPADRAPTPKKKATPGQIIGAIVALLIVGAIIGSIGGNKKKTPAGTTTFNDAPLSTPASQEAAPTEVAPAKAAPGFGDGTHEVGSDVSPGVYRALSVRGNCYWARLKGLGGEFDDIIANENSSGPTVVEIRPTDAGFQSRGCGRWTPLGGGILPSRTSFGEGTFLVGLDFEPGTYRAPGEGANCYWARLSAISPSGVEGIIANENTEGAALVKIAASDKAFVSRGCGTWTRSG